MINLKKKIIVSFIIFLSFILVACTSTQTEIPNDNEESVKEETQSDDLTKEDEEGNSSKSNEEVETNENLIDMEEKMLTLINEERAKNDLNKLSLNEDLRNVARIKSKDIAENDYFSHTSPTYGSPFDMMKEFEISFIKAAENLAGDRSVQSAHKGLMNSKGHRKNILEPDLSQIGIGIKEDDKYGYIFTQMFITQNRE